MKWMEVAVVTDPVWTEAVANIFHELNCGGVVIDDPATVRSYLACGAWAAEEAPDFLPPGREVTVRGYLAVNEELSPRLARLRHRLAQVADAGLQVKTRQVDESQWATAWQAYYKPLRLGRHLVVKPVWEEYTPAPGDVVLTLDPGMAFGTGTHASTAMCLELLEDYPPAGRQVLDLGTGSGILAVAAARLGAARVQAIDFDAVAVKVAQDNLRLNGVENLVDIKHGDARKELPVAPASVDLVLANIIAAVIIEVTPVVAEILRPGGIFIASGIIDERKDEVRKQMQACGLAVQETRIRDHWVAVAARKG